MVYRLLALDIDGTLLQENNRLDRKTKSAIHYVQQKGVDITLITERHFHSAKKIAKALKINGPIATHEGAFIAEEVDQPIYENRIDPATVAQLVDLLETYNCRIFLKHEKSSVGNRAQQKSMIAKMTVNMTDPLFYPINYVDSLGDYLLDYPQAPTRIDVIFNNDIQEQEMKDIIQRHFPELECKNGEAGKVEVFKEGTSKLTALQKIADYYHVPMNSIVAVGDSANDIDMIKAAGLGVSMKNAPEHVQHYADWVTRSNDMEGVAYMVKEVFRKQLRVQI